MGKSIKNRDLDRKIIKYNIIFKFIIFFEGGRKIDVVLSDMAPNLSGTLTYQLIFLVYFYYYNPPLS